MKTFTITLGNGQKRDVEQLATFTADVQGERFRFVVIHDAATISLTHRDSGKRVAKIEYASIQAARGDYTVAGKAALAKVIERAGDARVRSVLAAG